MSDAPTPPEGESNRANKRAKAEQRAARAKELVEQQRRNQRRNNLLRGGAAVVVLAVLVAVFIVIGNSGKGDKLDAASVPVDSEYSVTIGPDSAPNKVVVYEDFLCPFCDMLETATRDGLSQAAQSGSVQVSYRPFDLLGQGQADSYSVRAAGAFSVVLKASGTEVAKKFHDLLYENQPSETGPFPDNAALLKLAVQAGADSSAVSDGIMNNSGVDWVTAATQQASDAKVNSTPTVLLNGKQFGSGQPIDTLATNLITAVSKS